MLQLCVTFISTKGTQAMINRRMPNITFHIGAPNSMARKAQLLDEMVNQIPVMIEKAKDDKNEALTYTPSYNYYLDGVIDQLNDILEYVRINNL